MSERVWLDESPVDPAWPAPATDPAGRPSTGSGRESLSSGSEAGPSTGSGRETLSSGRENLGSGSEARPEARATRPEPVEGPASPARWKARPALVYGALALALVLAVGGIWAGGGFRSRHDLLGVVQPGELIDSEPYQFRFSSATAQRKVSSLDGKVTWEVVVIGEGRTTGDSSISPNYYGDSGMFVAKDTATGEVQSPTAQRFGDDRGFSRTSFTPGLPLMPYRLTFTFTEAYRPGPTLLFAMLDQEFTAVYFLEDQKSWNNSSHGEQLRLPVTVVAEQPS